MMGYLTYLIFSIKRWFAINAESAGHSCKEALQAFIRGVTSFRYYGKIYGSHEL